MTAWTKALRDSRVPGIPGLRAARIAPLAWLAAVTMDEAHVTPETVMRGTMALAVGDARLREGVELLLAEVLGGDVTWCGAHDVAPGGLLVTHDGTKTSWALQAGADGCSVLVIVADDRDPSVGASMALVDEVRVVEHLLEAGVVAAFVYCVTGSAPTLRPRMRRLSVDEALSCVHVGSTAKQCADRIGRLLDATGAPAEAKPVGEAAGAVVKRLSDMTGFGDAGRWGVQLADDLHAYRAGLLPWADVDRGMLLSGPPGSGKTTFAKALALEAEVDLVSTTYSDWHGAGSGDTVTKSLTKLFDGWRTKAAKAPFILLVDEIDSIGARGGAAHNESWYAPIVNAWLAFLDGAVAREGIVVVAATNHAERVDPAMLRPGRLDRHVELPYPDIAAMAGVVRHHLGPGADCPEADLARAARACRGMSPATVAQVCREARRMARRMFGRPASADDVTLVLGAQRLERLQRPGAAALDRRIAVHEAAHAVAILASPGEMLSHVDADEAMTWSTAPLALTLAQVESRLTVLLAGLAAEQTLLGGHSSGVSGDLRDATVLATSAHARWGMGVLGYRVTAPEDALADDAVRVAVDAILDAAHARARALVEGSREAVLRLAGRLQEDRYLDAGEVRAIVDDPRPAPPRTGYGDRVARVIGRGRHREPTP